jgi:hypothetical protein
MDPRCRTGHQQQPGRTVPRRMPIAGERTADRTIASEAFVPQHKHSPEPASCTPP